MVIKIENISKSFGERKLFHNLSLELERGKIYTLMGANGSGKTKSYGTLYKQQMDGYHYLHNFNFVFNMETTWF